MFVSLVLTDFLATLVLRSVPTGVAETTVIEGDPTEASVEVGINVAGAVANAVVEVRQDYETVGDAGHGGWRVWDVDPAIT